MRVGAVVGQFLMLGDLYQQQQATLMTGNGSITTYSGTLPVPLASVGSIFDSAGALAGSFVNGAITGSGKLASGSINYTTGALSLTFGSAPAAGDVIFAQYTLEAPARVQWSAIGDPTNWPTPLTQSALAAQSGFQDLETPELGPVMFIAGYNQYALIFQREGITRAGYIGGAPVFSFVPYEYSAGCIAHGAALRMGSYVFYLSSEGFMLTDGASVVPFGTTPDNSAGIDNWFWGNVNENALEAIRCGYDAQKRSIFFAIPTGSNTLPDTLLTFNPKAKKWAKASVPCQTIWTADNGEDGSPGTRQALGLFDQTGTPNFMNGSTLTGFLESIDVFFVDGQRRLCTSAKPHVNSTDSPLVTVGARDSLQDPVTYGDSNYQDPFSREAPALSSGKYLRVRTQSQNATSLNGETLMLEPDGGI